MFPAVDSPGDSLWVIFAVGGGMFSVWVGTRFLGVFLRWRFRGVFPVGCLAEWVELTSGCAFKGGDCVLCSGHQGESLVKRKPPQIVVR